MRNTLANAAVRFFQVAAAFVYMPFLISSFGLANYGVFLLAGSLSIYLGLLDFGVNPTVVKHVAEYVARDRTHEIARLLSNAATFYAVAGLVAATFLALFGRWGVEYLALQPVEAQLATRLFYVAAVVALFVWPLGMGAAVLNGLQRYDLTAQINLAVVLANLVLVAVVLIAQEGPLVLFAAMGVVAVVAGAASCVLAARHLPSVRPSFGLMSRSGLRLLFGFSWMVFIFQIAVVIADQQTDRLILGAFAGAAAIALYEPAARLHLLTAALASLTHSALIPAAAKLDAESRPEALRALYLRGSKYTVALVTPVAVSLIVLAHPLLTTWLGPEFSGVSGAAQLFLLPYIMYANLAVAFPVFIGSGRLRFIALYTLTKSLVKVALSLALVGEYGVLGVILGSVIGDALFFPIGMRYTLRTFGIRPAEYVRTVVVPAYPLLALPALVGWAAIQAGLTATLPGVAVAIVVAVGSYWVLTYRTGLTPHERDDVRATLTSVKARVSRSLHRGRVPRR
ncbi:MAG TPA: polysaccharide biosynthesis C-terminal domain-containing protein [Coriobacteriia bacterium]|nr:polysaccharide biosynthesis C-terminal domain-containing protein [Coriobacteriia bacterium]